MRDKIKLPDPGSNFMRFPPDPDSDPDPKHWEKLREKFEVLSIYVSLFKEVCQII